MFRKSSPADYRIVRKKLADGTVREYRYPRKRVTKTQRVASDSIDALLAAYFRGPEFSRLSKQSQANYRIALRPLYGIGQSKVADLRRRQILAIRDAIAVAKKRGPSAAQSFIKCAKVLLAWAVDRGWVDHSPTQGIKALEGGHLPTWTPAHYEASQALPEALRRVVVLGAFTGQRRGDLIALRWSDYDGEAIRLTQGKTGVRLVLPAHTALRRELATWRQVAGVALLPSAHILTSPKGRSWVGSHLSHEMPSKLAALGLPPLGVHGLRKLAANNLAKAGCSIHEICALLGWKTLAMAQLYTQDVEQETLARAGMARLEDARQPGKVVRIRKRNGNQVQTANREVK